MTQPIDLNTLPSFSWAACSEPEKGFGKVSIGGEAFWINNIARAKNGRFTGHIDNELVCTDTHGLMLGDFVIFSPTET